ncbi:universal stress protein UspA-like protein [Mycolicibacterium phlei]|jgi:nucleotide-binding universal stress UspA family protein|nr:Universal stress protein [Mycolicibacterium phlei]STZ21596.1 universal stress protein UspA-like protein [Mycolicibacterium phlei]VEG11233.1 universal stress protein UspA-like protein [Mycobacteroides chelonae]
MTFSTHRGMQRGIVAAVDGSPAATAAVSWAAKEAALRHVPLKLVHVVPVPAVAMWPPVPTPPELLDSLTRRGRELLDKAQETAKSVAGDITISTDVVTGVVVPSLVEAAEGADMVVVGCRGLGAIERRLLGSVSWGLLHHARCPVAVIHADAPEIDSTAPVVVGVDGSPASDAAVAAAFDEASRRGVELVAVHAWSDWSNYYEVPGVQPIALEREAEEILAERLAGWQEQYPDVTVRRVVVMDRPAHQLLEQAKTAQLTVLGSRGRGGFVGMLLGSVSAAVAESAHTPVLVMRRG